MSDFPKTKFKSRKTDHTNPTSVQNALEPNFANLQISNQTNQRQTFHSAKSRAEYKATNATNPDDQLSSSLFFALKNPEKLGLQFKNGFIDLLSILKHPTLARKNYTFDDVKRVIDNRSDKNFGRFTFRQETDRMTSVTIRYPFIGLIADDVRNQVSSPKEKRGSLIDVLFNAQFLGLVKSPGDLIDCTEILKIGLIELVNMRIADMERILNDPSDRLYGKFIFLRYESGTCKIKDDLTFTLGTRKAKVTYPDQSYSDRDLSIAKTLVYILRHNADALKFEMSDDGFVELDAILKFMAKKQCTIDDINRIISLEEYPRFTLIEYEPDKYKIKCTHGHTIPRIMAWNWANWKLETKLPVLVTRCNYPAWFKLRTNGYEKRQTFNFLDPANSEYRKNREVEIFIDAEAARKDGVKFFSIPENEMIVTEGLEGTLPLKYFMKVVDRASGELVKIR